MSCSDVDVRAFAAQLSPGDVMTTRTLISSSIATMFALAVTVQVHVSGQGQRAPVSLPDGAGRELVQKTCSQCHGLELVTRSGYSQDEWLKLFSTMVALPKGDADTIAQYLAAHYPEKARAKAVIIPGNVRVNIKEWDVPSLGSRPHDPLPASDGSLWWTGQWANVLGRLDLKTGAMKEFPLKTPKSGPHGLVEDKTGNIWFTANSAGYIGKLNPKTGEVTEYPMPDKAARDPHTPLFDRKGMLWFTVQQGNFVGRVNPETGEVKLQRAPTADSKPYGIVLDSKGTPWYVAFGTNKIAKIDTATMAITEYTLPHADSRPRRLTITDDDVVWYADHTRGYLGKYDPKTGKMTEYPSPGGRESLPYGIAAVKDIVWYSEAGVTPNTLVRFDPKTEKFQTWPIPSGGGVIRNMYARPDGNLVIACSGVNKVGLVEISAGPTSR